ncbi:MAG: hypothetical protein CMJ89_12475 [Planctomycetes bacterium]|nr:hypothetical protein [Planctomycetota bacterium]
MARFKRLGLLVAALLLPLYGLGHVRLIHPGNGLPLFWAVPSNIEIVISSIGSDNLSDGSEEIALRMAIEEWNATSGTSARLVENTSPAAQARTDWHGPGGPNDIHLVYFDEVNASGYFPENSSTVAITPIFFFGNGQIADADILFNGSGWNFSTSSEVGHFDVGDVGAHEIGHLLGLNHSAFMGSTMYPYVDPSVLLHRSISVDETGGLRDAYPSGSYGRISGRVLRMSNLFPVPGAYVVATDANGRTAASLMTDTSGNFSLPGMDPGTYTVSAVPLGSTVDFGDAPVDSNNLGGGYFIDTDFEPAVYASTAVITGTENISMGTLLVDEDVQLNLGTSSDRFPLRVTAGQSTNLIVHGKGLFGGDGAALTASDPDFLISPPSYFGTQIHFQLTVPAGEPLGHVDMTFVNSLGHVAILPGGLEVTGPTPTVTGCVPAAGARAGGTTVTITGTNFSAGNRIVIGDQIYTDGVNGTTVVPSNGVGTPGSAWSGFQSTGSIRLTTLATTEGVHDVVVFDGSGLDGRLVGGYQSLYVPMVGVVFPVSGEFSGGTVVTVSGQDFQEGMTARIDGVDQGAVTFFDSTQVSFATIAGSVGGPYILELENPDKGIATSAFTFAANPDPLLSNVMPGSGSAGGGDTITVTGSNFTTNTTVSFGADPFTGLGGTPAAGVTLVDAGTLTVETPSHSFGVVSVMVSDTSSSQAGVLASSFTFLGSGGGFGCHMVPVRGPQGPKEILAGLWWILLVLGLLKLRSRCMQPALQS